MTASQAIRGARRSAGLTQAQLGERLGASQSVVARLERPDANPTWASVTRVLLATGHDLELTRRPAPAAGVDLDQLRERLALTPGERLRLFQESQLGLESLRSRARRRAHG